MSKDKQTETESKAAKASNCICTKCYKPNCKTRNGAREKCPECGPYGKGGLK